MCFSSWNTLSFGDKPLWTGIQGFPGNHCKVQHKKKYGDVLQGLICQGSLFFFLELAFDLIDIFILQHPSGSSVALRWDYCLHLQ